jgi:hypothetical protein
MGTTAAGVAAGAFLFQRINSLVVSYPIPRLREPIP